MHTDFVNNRKSAILTNQENVVVAAAWSPPASKYFKINTDAAFDVRTGVAKLGVVIQELYQNFF